MGGQLKYYWMAVTPDEYELPLIVEGSVKELASKLGIDYTTVISRVNRGNNGTRTGNKLVKVIREEFETL